MAEREATIAMPNGRLNGYYHGGCGAEAVVLAGAEQCVTLPVFLPTPDGEAVTSPPQPTAKSTTLCPRAMSATRKVTPSPIEASKQSRRKSKTGVSKTANKKKPPKSGIKYVPQAAVDRDLAKLEKLSQAVLAGDTTAIDELRAALDCCPHIWKRLADLQYQVELKLINLVAGADPLRAEAFRKNASELRYHLLDGVQLSLATKMAASRVVACWMFTQFLDLRALESPRDNWSTRQLQAERRYQTAMRTFCLARQADVQLARLTQQ
jgi:hypothetical protein